MNKSAMATVLGCGTAVMLALLGVIQLVGEGEQHEQLGTVKTVVGEQANSSTRVTLTLVQTLASGSVLLFAATISWMLELDLSNMLLTAYVRTAGQLAVLGLILTPILTSNSLIVVIFVALLMVLIASVEVHARMEYVYKGFVPIVATSLTVGVGLNMIVCLCFIQPEPIWSPLYSIPMWGMTLGNALSAVTLGTGLLLEGLGGEQLKHVETILCHGGTRFEALRPLLASCLRKGLVPVINQMNVIGLVYLPGMMTGQLLGGASATQACYYQMLIMFMIASSTACSLFLSLVGSVHCLSDDKHRILTDLLVKKEKSGDPLTRLYRSLGECYVSLGAFPFFLVVSLSVCLVSYISKMLGLFPELPLSNIITISLFASVTIGPLMLVFALRKRSHEEEPLLG